MAGAVPVNASLLVTPSEAHALRLHERVEGDGTIMLGDATLVAAWYTLKDVEELHRIGAGDVRIDARPGARTVFGLLRGPAASLLSPLIGARLRLRLADGRVLPFTITKVLQETYLIQALGGFQ